MGSMSSAERSRIVLLTAMLLLVSLPYSPAAADTDGSCCASQEIDVYLIGSADDGSLSPFDSDLDEEFEQFVHHRSKVSSKLAHGTSLGVCKETI